MFHDDSWSAEERQGESKFSEQFPDRKCNMIYGLKLAATLGTVLKLSRKSPNVPIPVPWTETPFKHILNKTSGRMDQIDLSEIGGGIGKMPGWAKREMKVGMQRWKWIPSFPQAWKDGSSRAGVGRKILPEAAETANLASSAGR
jgi:hypothetical protein